MKSAKVLLTVVACMIGVGNCQSQCDWSGKFIQALQQRGGIEEACKMLTLPPAEFDRTHLLFEHQTFQKLHLLQLPSIQTPMQEYANRYLRHAGIAAQEEVNIVDDPQPNAFATGQMVFLHSGIVDWYLRPDVALMKLGFSRSQANQYLSQISGDYPGKTGLLAVLAHETAHNVLGHPDAQPVANSCNEFINAGVSRIKSYEEELATGRKPSQVKELLKGITLNYAQTFVDSQSQQRVESEADAYGAYLVWKETGDPQAMAKSLKWLADFPGILPNSRSGVAFEALCSNHPNMLQRVNDAQSLVVSLTSSGHAPQVRTSALPDTLKRYQQFEVWYPKRVEELNRVAQGKLTPEEAQTVRAVHIETKPKGAMLAVDGKSIGNGPTDRELTIGPHQITAGKEKLTGQLDIVVFPDAPKKVKVDLH